MLGQMTTELKCRAMLSLQQLYTPENFVFFVFGWRVEARGKSRYKLISLTFQETLLFPLSAPHPNLPQAFLHTHTPGQEYTGWHRAERREEDDAPGVRNSTGVRSIPPLTALIMILHG